VWRKGNRWRVDLCLGKGKEARKLPEPDEKLADWLNKYHEYPFQLCDGRAVYHFDRSSPESEGSWKLWTTLRSDSVEAASSAAGSSGNASSAMAELAAYPSLAPSAQFDLTLDPKPSEGPAGTLLITSTARVDLGPGVYRKSRYWVDPSHGYAVVRYEHGDLAGKKDEAKPTGHDPDVYELEEFVKSPTGQWYPTTIRRKNAVHKTDKEGQEVLSDDVRTFYYDFKAELPDDLFKNK
jgi:hypothetical protein